MKWPSLPRISLPNWISNLRFPRLFRKDSATGSFYAVWKKFIRQIPAESRPTIKSYQHFIVLGGAKSGKTDLIQGLTEQSQDLYPFDTSYTEFPDVQFYLGPTQVIQEISYTALEDKSIKVRKKIIKLWKSLYAHRDPIIVVVYNCFSSEHQNLRELNQLAQLIAGKVTLLSEITKKPCKIRIALTNLDKVPGYLEFARFIKQQNLEFNINLSSDFDTNALENALKRFYEEHVTQMLTTNSNPDFAKILRFSKEMPLLFPNVEEFLRALVTRVSFAGSIELDMLSLTSNQRTNTAFSPFEWKRQPSMELFFRYPLLKHQMAASFLFVAATSILSYTYLHERNELHLAQRGIEQLDLLQFHTFQHEILPDYVSHVDQQPDDYLYHLYPPFFHDKLRLAKSQLATRIRKHFIDREVRKAVLEHQGELKCLYFLGLMHSSSDNHLGKFILKNSKQIARSLNIEEDMLKAYVLSCPVPLIDRNASPLHSTNPFLPLTSFKPWMAYLDNIQELLNFPILIDQQFDDVIKDTDKLLVAVSRVKHDQFAHPIATLLEEQIGVDNSEESIRVIRWLGENIDALCNYLAFIHQTSTLPLDIEGLNIAQFFTKIKERSSLKEQENQTYHFKVEEKIYSFQTTPWIDLVIAHNVEHAIHNYITANTNTAGEIFFKNTTEAPEPALTKLAGPVPLFKNKISIPGRYSRVEYEKKVKTTAEKLVHLIDSLAINPEEKKRFKTFLTHEVINYMKSYQDHYARFFDTYDVPKNITLDNLKVVLNDLAHLSSNFHDFLVSIHYHTSPFSDPVLSLQSTDTINEFAFLNNIFSQDTGEAPIGGYHRIIAQLIKDLEKDAFHHQSNGILDPYLTPAALVSANILQNGDNSYLNRVNVCLEQMGIPDKYRNPFVKPILQLHQIGMRDLKKAVEQVWTTHFTPKIEALFTKFPFDPSGTVTISVEELNQILNPKADFYNTITQVMSVCCNKKDGIWHSIDPQSMKLDERITTALTAVQNISDLLWDKEGNPQPINLNIKTVPFAPSVGDSPNLVLSYLVVGNEAIRNLNQTPAWHTIKIDWWKEDNCLVGVELLNKDAKSKSYRNVQKLHTSWCFFELLREANQEFGNTWSWEIASKEGKEPYKVSFSFEANPLQLLQIPDYH